MIFFQLANLLIIAFGCGLGWLSVALPLLQSNESPLESGAISLEELSWIGSLISIGALTGNVLVGYIVTSIGSRNSIFMLGVPQLVGDIIKNTQIDCININLQTNCEPNFLSIEIFKGWMVFYDIWNISRALEHIAIFIRCCCWRRSNLYFVICRRNR